MKQQLHRLTADVKMKKAFTLIELLVVISIIAILTAIIVPNFRDAEKQFALQRSAHKLAQDIRKVQEMAMSAKEFHGVIPRGGYGIFLRGDSTRYILFADCDGGGNYDESGICGDQGSEKIEEIILEKGVKINRIGSLDWYSGVVIFIPPDPIVSLTLLPAGTHPQSLSIVISLEADPTKTKTITVNKAGLINTE